MAGFRISSRLVAAVLAMTAAVTAAPQNQPIASPNPTACGEVDAATLSFKSASPAGEYLAGRTLKGPREEDTHTHREREKRG